MIKSIIISLFVTFAFAAKCPDIPVKADFDVSKYLGKWHEIERFPFAQEDDLKCVSAEYTLNADNSVKVNNTGVNIKSNKFSQALGKAVIKDASQPSKLSVTFSKLVPISAPYWIIDTDYETSVVYSCTSILGLVKLEYAWILSRSPTLRAEKVEQLKSVLKSHNINVAKFEVTNQNDCL